MIQFDLHNPADLPPDEALRQQAVDRSHALLHKQDPALQLLALAAADSFGVPMAAITIIDHERQCLLASIGLDADEMPRAISFCTHAILQPGEIFVVTDARRDRRFANNPIVQFAPHIRFYAGVPLLDRRGFALGSFCILDAKPRAAPEDLSRLSLLARKAERVIAHWDVAD